jgi:hypothetical protein
MTRLKTCGVRYPKRKRILPLDCLRQMWSRTMKMLPGPVLQLPTLTIFCRTVSHVAPIKLYQQLVGTKTIWVILAQFDQRI